MLTSSEQLGLPTEPQKVNLLEEENFLYLASEITIPGSQLGSSLWAEMIKETQSDGRERGIVTGTFGGKLTASKIFTGHAENTLGKNKSVAHIDPPNFPFGIKSFSPFRKDLAFVHSHPKPPKLAHLQTTLPSDGDIRTYMNSPYKALVMVDPGGVHLVLRVRNFVEETLPPNFNLHEKALTESAKGNNTVVEAMRVLGNLLYPLGMRYYYSPNLNLNDEEQVTLSDVHSQK